MRTFTVNWGPQPFAVPSRLYSTAPLQMEGDVQQSSCICLPNTRDVRRKDKAVRAACTENGPRNDQ